MLGLKEPKGVFQMSSDIAISVMNVSKSFRTFNSPKDRLKQGFMGAKKKYYKEFHALKDISFELMKGEMLGIIGRNGSGKSTLLQIIAGTLTPTGGEIQCNGRIAALLELGSGFNPEYTGKENVFLNAAILGLSSEQINERYDEIVNFSEIGDFIDQPVKTYSSGMFVRLAFSVVIHVNPDILIVDEALAVGDVFFQRKCFSRIKELNEKGCTLIYVTHELANLKQIVNRAILLDTGHLLFDGTPVDAVNKFYKNVYGAATIQEKKTEHTGGNDPNLELLEMKDRERYGDRTAEIIHVSLEDTKSIVWSGSPLILNVSVKVHQDIISPLFGIRIKTTTGIDVFASNTRDEGTFFEDLKGGYNYQFEIIFNSFNLIGGEYFLSLAIGCQDIGEYTPIDHRIDAINLKVLQKEKSTGIINLQPQILLKRN